MTALRFIRLVTAGGALLLLCSAPVRADVDNFKSVEDSSPEEVVGAMSLKFVRGLANAATGWLELPKQIYVTFRDEGAAMGLTVGPLKGIGMTIVRTVTGATEAATFFVPYPGFFSPYFEPPYVWDVHTSTAERMQKSEE